MSWANNYGMTFPVGSDPGWNIYESIWSSNFTPVSMLIAPGVRSVSEDFVSDQ